MKKILLDDKPHLCLFAIKHINIGEEITYNYGDSNWPWRNIVSQQSMIKKIKIKD